MPNDKNNNVKDPAKAEELVKKELQLEHMERYKTSRLLGLSMSQGIGVGAALVVGLALVVKVLGASYTLTAIVGAVGAVALTILLVTAPNGLSKKE